MNEPVCDACLKALYRSDEWAGKAPSSPICGCRQCPDKPKIPRQSGSGEEMVNDDRVATEIAEAVREVLGPEASEDAVVRALAERVLQRLEAGGLAVTHASGELRWMPDYRS